MRPAYCRDAWIWICCAAVTGRSAMNFHAGTVEITITPLPSTTMAASAGVRHADSSASRLTFTAVTPIGTVPSRTALAKYRPGMPVFVPMPKNRPEPCARESLKYGRYDTLVPMKLTGRFQLLAAITDPCRSMTSTATLPASRFTASR
ncbi:hypothetical protein ADM96_38695 [Burkholderia sp. ST111]|nr:hypothetical protein ADM96_38695 [Burkholderia sp. ST111]